MRHSWLVLIAGSALAAQTSGGGVMVPLVARDGQGQVVRNLTAADLRLTVDGARQTIEAMPLQDLDGASPLPAGGGEADWARRHVVLYFDLTTLTAKDESAAVESAQYFIQHGMRPNDMAAVAMLGESLQMVQDFTADRRRLTGALEQLGPALAGGGGDAVTGGEAELSAVDEDLMALQSLCDEFGKLPYPKTLLLYSGGLARSGSQNEITLRSAVNAAVKGDVVVDGIDARLLPVRVAGGSAASASPAGKGGFNGQAQVGQLNAQQQQRDTLSALSSDTGGMALLDSADDTALYEQSENAEQIRYLISFTPNPPKHDGKFHKYMVQCVRPGVRLTYPQGYWALKSK